jgi:hypothetical protein
MAGASFGLVRLGEEVFRLQFHWHGGRPSQDGESAGCLLGHSSTAFADSDHLQEIFVFALSWWAC